MSQTNVGFDLQFSNAHVDWHVDGLEKEPTNRLQSQIFLEIYSQVLKKLSMINRDDLIGRSHKNENFEGLHFFFDLSQGGARTHARSQ